MIETPHRNRGWLAVILPLMLAATTAQAGEKLERQERRTVDLKGQNRLIVKNARGKTIVLGQEGLNQVRIVADERVVAKDTETAQGILNALEIGIEVDDERITVVTHLPKAAITDRSFWAVITGERRGVFVDYTIEVPKRFGAHVVTTSGDVEITTVAGAVQVNATSGDVLLRDVGGESAVELTSGTIVAENLGGDLRVAASSGDARVRRVKGVVAIQATSGNVDASEIGGDAIIHLVTGKLGLKGCLGNVNFSTASGDAEIEEVLGSVSASSSSGNLDVVIVPVGEKEFRLNTSSGNVVLNYLPVENYGFYLDVNTCTGTIEGDLEIRHLDKIARRTLKGVVGSGKGRVMIETASGNVSIVELKEDR